MWLSDASWVSVFWGMPCMAFFQPVNLTTDTDSFEHRQIRFVKRLGKQVPNERILRLIPSLVNDDQIRIVLGRVKPCVEEGWLFCQFIKKHASGLQQLLPRPRLYLSEND